MEMFGAFGWWLACVATFVVGAVGIWLNTRALKNMREADRLLSEARKLEVKIGVACGVCAAYSRHPLLEVAARGYAKCPECDTNVLRATPTTSPGREVVMGPDSTKH